MFLSVPFQNAYLSLLGMQTVKGGVFGDGFFLFGFCWFCFYAWTLFWDLSPVRCWLWIRHSVVFILHSLNVFDMFIKMGLLQEFGNEFSTSSSLSSSAAGVWGCGVWRGLFGSLLLLIPARNQVVRFLTREYNIEAFFRMTCESFKQDSCCPFSQHLFFWCGSQSILSAETSRVAEAWSKANPTATDLLFLSIYY